MEHDPTFEYEIDAYVSDDDERDRPHQALRRLTSNAMSFLSRAYPNPVEADRARLQRFHSQAVSFLDCAYADDPVTPVNEEDIPPEQLLQRFHHEAMSFLHVVPGTNSAARIERDKARLEQHYQDAMSFLNRADKGRGLVEEQELEAATVERFQLQKYAREAMSFLDKAFREDASVMVEDEDLSPQKVDEDTQIAADRAALEKYDEEYGDFLSKAYEDDCTVIVEDADSETSGMEGGLYARKMAASTTSADTYSGSVTQEDDLTDDAYTDDEFQDPEVAERSRLDVLERHLPATTGKYAPPGSSGDTGTDDNESLRHKMARYEKEADDYLEGANVSESEDESDGADISGDVGHVLIEDDGSRMEHDINGHVRGIRSDVVTTGPDELHSNHDQFGADREIEEEQQLSPRVHFGADRDIHEEQPLSPGDHFGADREINEEQPLSPGDHFGADREINEEQPLSPGDHFGADREINEEEQLSSRDHFGADREINEEQPLSPGEHFGADQEINEEQPLSPGDNFGADREINEEQPLSPGDQFGADREINEEQPLSPGDHFGADREINEEEQFSSRGHFGADREINEGHPLSPGDHFGADREINEERQVSWRDIPPRRSTERSNSTNNYESHTTSSPDKTSAPQVSPIAETVRSNQPMDPTKISPALVPLRSSSGKRIPRFGPSAQRPPRAPDPQNLMVDMILEKRSGQPSEWSEVQLARSFYRQLPRGSTIKLRPKVSPQLPSSGQKGSSPSESPNLVSSSELQRVEKERDAALASLEEIVNERSMLAAQVSEMKAMINKNDHEEDTKSEETQDIDLAAELADAHETMAKLTEEMEATLSVVDRRYHDTLKRAHEAEERNIRLETNASRLESEFASQGMRLSQAMAEEQRMHSMLARREKEFESLRRKSEKDIQRIDESYREESSRNMRRIRELTAEVTTLQEKLAAAASSTDRNIAWTPQKRLELEVSTLKRRLAESERKLVEEQLAGERKMDEELHRAKSEHNEEIEKLASQLDRVQLDAKNADGIRRELEREQTANRKNTEQLIELEHKLADLQNEVIEARRGQVAAEAEAKHVRLRYEESLKKRISQMGHSSEMVEIQTSLQGLREEAANRERVLQQQLEDFRKRAEQAEDAAASAEKDAQEAADVAKQGQLIIESEREARKTAEAEVQRAVQESRAWEKLVQQQKEKGESTGLVISSSRRGIRRGQAGAKDGKKKKEKASASDEPRKKTSHRPRLFG